MPRAINLSQLAFRMRKYADAAAADALAYEKLVAHNVLLQVVDRTPVDVGTARSNWIVTTNSAPSTRVRRAFFPYLSRTRGGKGGNRSETANSNLALLNGDRTLERLPLSNNIVVTISNNLPYIERLENGYSKQSSAGLIRAGITAGVRLANAQFAFKNMEKV